MYEFQVLWTGKYYQSWENEAHSHSFFQMIAITKGEGCVEVDGCSYQARPPMVFLIRPHQTHAVRRPKNAPAPQLMDIKFNVNDEQLRRDLEMMDSCWEPENFRRFQKTFDYILKESEEKGNYYYQRISYHFGLLLTDALLERLEKKEVETVADAALEPVGIHNGIDMDSLIRHIHQNYAHIISLNDLAAMTNTSKTTLIQVFKSVYGTTPIKYLNDLRLEKAKELLVNTDANVGEISELIGFQSIHYFSRYFKNREGIPPNEFRLRHSKSHFYTYRLPNDAEQEKLEDMTK